MTADDFMSAYARADDVQTRDRMEIATRIYITTIEANIEVGQWLCPEDIEAIATSSVNAANTLLKALKP